MSSILKEKAKNHAERDREKINFAWVIFTGMQIGYTEKEIAHMYFGKWADLFKEFKRMHNYKMKRMIFEEEKKVESLMDL